ncbi:MULTISPECIES: hypothetical protein [Limosilactobacillus]|nr:hypothetical protein [Limosilactobacillus panis]
MYSKIISFINFTTSKEVQEVLQFRANCLAIIGDIEEESYLAIMVRIFVNLPPNLVALFPQSKGVKAT